MKLERKYARRILVLFALTILLVCLPLLMYNVLGAQSWAWSIIGVGGAIVCMASGSMLRMKHLRCPYCKRGVAVPQWKANGKRYVCSCCKKPFVYDDEA